LDVVVVVRQPGLAGAGVEVAGVETAAAADWLVEQQAGLVGIDSVNIDDPSGQPRPVHTALLAAGIPIVEHLCGLDQLLASGFRFHAAPPQVVGIGTFPVRAYAVLAEG
jgi:arylformamidase